MSSSLCVGIVGATGYTGAELLRLLANHPKASVSIVTARNNTGIKVADFFPSLRGFYDLSFSHPDDSALYECDAVFFATPHGVAMHDAPKLLEKGIKVIDLSADFRIKDKEVWQNYYQMPHQAPQWLEQAVYGLPEMNPAAITNAQLVANPGCYPTAVTLPLIPLLQQAALKPQSPIIADCKSGVSGAGRSAKIAHLFSEAADNLKAYGIAGHRHLPEIQQSIRELGGIHELIFVPHLIPMIRGMLASLYIETCNSSIDVHALLADFYRHHAFVDILDVGISPETRSVRAANFCRIGVQQLPGSSTRWLLLSVIDNLVKGAAGQAIQNFNLMFDLPETTGLRSLPVMP